MIELPTESEPVKVIEGDCLDVLRRLPDGCVDAVVTDPPYGIRGGVVRSARKVVTGLPEWDYFDPEWVRTAVQVLKPGGSIITFTDTRRVGEIWDRVIAVGMHARQVVFWIKHAPPPCPRSSFQSSVETLVWSTKGVTANWNGGGLTPNVWYGNLVKSNRLHPTQKPLDLMRWLVRLITPPGSVVLDPFAGSGTTGVAAIQEGRRALLIEKEPAYAAIARKRVEAAMGSGLLAGLK